MRTLSSQDLTLISGGFSDDSFESFDDEIASAAFLIKGSFIVGREGALFIDKYIENSYLQTTLKFGLLSSIILFDTAVVVGALFSKAGAFDDDY